MFTLEPHFNACQLKEVRHLVSLIVPFEKFTILENGTISFGFLPHFQTVKTRKLDHHPDLFAFCFPLYSKCNNHYRNIHLCVSSVLQIYFMKRHSVRWQTDILIWSQDSEKREGRAEKIKNPTCDIT